MKPKNTCMYKIYHGEEKDKKRQGFDLKKCKLYSDEENIIQLIQYYKEINPYKRRLKPEKGNLKPKKARLHIIINKILIICTYEIA